MKVLIKVISGGQTGADQAGWRAARGAGLKTGGWMPQGFLTEDGPRPDFAVEFNAVEMPNDDYAQRTRANVRDSEGTIWFGKTSTPGGRCTLEACRQFGKPFVIVAWEESAVPEPIQLLAWINNAGIKTLNIAGNRESSEPGTRDRVESFLSELFEIGSKVNPKQ